MDCGVEGAKCEMECEVWSGEWGVKSVKCEGWSVWSVECEMWSGECEVWSEECELWRL